MVKVPKKPAILPDPFEWILIPGGKVNLRWWVHAPKTIEWFTTDVEPFFIAKYPITNAQYRVYVAETGNAPKSPYYWEKEHFNDPLQPVFDLFWQESMLFCHWLSTKTGYLITLPTEAQWQRAAQGDDNREYPWGNEWDSTCCNTQESGIGHTTPVTQYPQGASPFGVMDLAGNVWEWCLTDWDSGDNSLDFTLPEEETLNVSRIFKGGSCLNSRAGANVAICGATPIYFSYSTGIRIVTGHNPI